MVGTFADPAADVNNTQLSLCPTRSVGVTHSNGDRIPLSGPFSFQWTAPANETGPLWFRYTIVESTMVWWADDASAVVQEGKSIYTV